MPVPFCQPCFCVCQACFNDGTGPTTVPPTITVTLAGVTPTGAAAFPCFDCSGASGSFSVNGSFAASLLYCGPMDGGSHPFEVPSAPGAFIAVYRYAGDLCEESSEIYIYITWNSDLVISLILGGFDTSLSATYAPGQRTISVLVFGPGSTPHVPLFIWYYQSQTDQTGQYDCTFPEGVVLDDSGEYAGSGTACAGGTATLAV